MQGVLLNIKQIVNSFWQQGFPCFFSFSSIFVILVFSTFLITVIIIIIKDACLNDVLFVGINNNTCLTLLDNYVVEMYRAARRLLNCS